MYKILFLKKSKTKEEGKGKRRELVGWEKEGWEGKGKIAKERKRKVEREKQK